MRPAAIAAQLTATALLLGLCFTAQAQSPSLPPPQPKVDSGEIDPALRSHIAEPPRFSCVTQDYNGPFATARYVNKCPLAYRVTVVFGSVDDRSDFKLGPGKNHSNGLSIVDYRNRKGSNWYVCPKGYAAVDMKGQPFKRMVDSYLCREIGF